ncbi:putative Eukaryotic translation initiation factor 2A [Blattamonas nauphoetae]|uniref:Eukaryotic translation initiation factor 2A n=1 Tax=Blattamonas nauphoetae TaxID=2049346 RepID=A0ABQ9XK67_9EUKA|nr:putative Eukaryotic translation initiation factor 2A [Blattamonas nauphoetae]
MTAGQDFLLRSKRGVSKGSFLPNFSIGEADDALTLEGPLLFSNNGKYLAAVGKGYIGFTVIEYDSSAVVAQSTSPHCNHIAFSPQSSFLSVYYSIPNRERTTPNLEIWDLETKQLFCRFCVSEQTGPVVQWVQNESIFAMMRSRSSLDIFEMPAVEAALAAQATQAANADEPTPSGEGESKGTSDPLTVRSTYRLNIDHLSCFKIGHSPATERSRVVNPLDVPPFALFVSGTRNNPAFFSIYAYSSLVDHAKGSGKGIPKAIVSKNLFFDANSAEIEWSPCSRSCMCIARTDNDRQNKSYYGSAGCVFIDVTSAQVIVLKSGDKEISSMIHAASFNPTLGYEGNFHWVGEEDKPAPSERGGGELVVIHGQMPATVSVFSQRGKWLCDMCTAPVNTISFHPSLGRYCLVGAFGNLGSGDMMIFDLKGLNQKDQGSKPVLVGKICNPWGSDLRWSAARKKDNGEPEIFIVSAVCTPRLRVDNHFIVFSMTGETILKMDTDCLYDFIFRPTRNQLAVGPPITAEQQQSIRPPTGFRLNVASKDTPSAAPKKGAYRSPGISSAAADAFRSMMSSGGGGGGSSASHQSASGPPSQTGVGGRTIPGMGNQPQKKSWKQKNQEKKQRKQAMQQNEDD